MRFIALLLAACVATGSAMAADLTCTRVKVIVPFGPGGSADVVGRIVADKLGPALGTSMFIENKGGAAGNIGTQMVAEAPADGCTLLINGTVISTFLDSYNHLKYDPFKDLAPIGGLGITPSIVLAAPQLPANDLKGLIALSKTKPNGLTFAIAGYGLQQHLATEEIGQRGGGKFVNVPYKGGGPALTDVLAARVDFATLLGGTTKALVDSGKLKALAVLQDKRSKLLPNVPTAAEQGFPGLLGGVHFVLFAPGKTPKATIDTISAALARVVTEPELQDRFLKAGLEATPMTPDEVTAEMQAMRKSYQPIIQTLKIKLD